MKDQQEIETMTQQIRDRAPIAALNRAAYNQATGEEFQARLALLHKALEAARPAIREITDRLPILRSGPGCEIHGVAKGTNTLGAVSGVTVLPSVAVGLEGDSWAWWIDVKGDITDCMDRNCWSYDWRPVPAGKVLEVVPLVTVVKGLLERIDEQLSGARLKRARQFDFKAHKLRALATLLGPDAE
jgi:hypothetical protein